MKSLLFPGVVLLVSFMNYGEIRKQRGEEFPEIKWPMSAHDKKICHDQFSASKELNPDTGLSIDELLTRHGYPVTRINVTTDDGYILGVYRIPYSPRSPIVEGQVKKAVILNHGLGANGLCWVIQDGSRNLAMLLADSGFDVFISNCRGNSYSQGHVDPHMTLDTVDYWDFSVHEMGIYDVPAVIEMVTSLTTNKAMYYVGHSMGTASLTIMLAEKPEYNERISTAFLLAPAIYGGHTFRSFRWIIYFSNYYQYLFKKIMGGKLEGNKRIEKWVGKKPGFMCYTEKDSCEYCANTLFLSYGYDGAQMNYTTLGVLVGSFPDTISTKSWTHFVQFIKTDEFCQFNYGFTKMNERKYGNKKPPCYNLDNISAPVVMFWGENDVFVKPENVRKTVSKFPKAALKEVNRVNWPLFTHLDFVMAKDADTLVYNRMLDIMKNSTYE